MFGSGSPKCGKCDSTSFTMQEFQPNGAAHKFISVQCDVCSTPVGVLDYYNLGTLLKEQEGQLKAQQDQIAELRLDLQQMSGQLHMVFHYVQQLASKAE